MDTAERDAWIELALTPGVGPRTFLRLLQHFGSTRAVLSASVSELSSVAEKKAVGGNIANREGEAAAAAASAWAAGEDDASLLLLADEGYPQLLGEGISPPPLLFVRGNAGCLKMPAVAVVGSRHATPRAMRFARDLACDLAEKGIVVVSGMADGIDTAAHDGSLAANGLTAAVWGTGIDRVYPARNKALAGRIAASGCIASEFPLGTRAQPGNFPRRNRIIAGLASATVVVEAAVASGSLITARLAAEMGREVMAVPGSVDSPLSKGCHALIRQGAKLVETTDDVLQECPVLMQSVLRRTDVSGRGEKSAARSGSIPAAGAEKNPGNEHPALLEAMGFDPVHPDELSDRLGMAATDVYAGIMALELSGVVCSLPGGRFQRVTS